MITTRWLGTVSIEQTVALHDAAFSEDLFDIVY